MELLFEVSTKNEGKLGWKTEWLSLPVSKIRAFRYSGCGTAVIYYEGLTERGWLRFLKKHQPAKVAKKIPVLSYFPHTALCKTQDYVYTQQKIHYSDEVSFQCDPVAGGSNA